MQIVIYRVDNIAKVPIQQNAVFLVCYAKSLLQINKLRPWLLSNSKSLNGKT